MPTSGLTSAPSELGRFLSTFEQSRRKLREMEAEHAALAASAPSSNMGYAEVGGGAGGGGGGAMSIGGPATQIGSVAKIGRDEEAERARQLQQLRESVSSCRMQLAQLEREVELSESGMGRGGIGTGQGPMPPMGGSRSVPSGAGDHGGGPPSPADVSNRSFTVDGEVLPEFQDSTGEPYFEDDAYRYRDHTRTRDQLNRLAGKGGKRGYSNVNASKPGGGFDDGDGIDDECEDDFVGKAKSSRVAWNNFRGGLRDVTTRSSVADEMSALRSESALRTSGGDGSSARSLGGKKKKKKQPQDDKTVEIVEEIAVDDVDRDFDGRHEWWCDDDIDAFYRSWGRTRSKRIKKFSRFCLAAMGIALTIGLLVRHMTKSSDASAADGEGAEAANHPSRFELIKNRILQSGVTDESDLLELREDHPITTTPQYRALHWIVEHDAMGLDPDDPFLLQRYALAAFYYSSSDHASDKALDDRDNGGRDKTNWLTLRGICSWRGVQCHHRPGTSPDDTTFDDNGGVTHLEIPRHKMGGPIVPELFRALTDLRILDLSENELTGTLRTEIGRLAQLENLKLSRNDIEGPLPSELGQLSELQDLDLSENLLRGQIPSELGDLSSLVGLALFDNVLSGTIPDAFGRLSNLEVMYLDSNELTGTIPFFFNFDDLNHLYDLRLRDNHLSGTIGGPHLEIMSKLKLLYLDSNELTGTVPPEVGTLTGLSQLHLFKNSLTGTLPSEVGAMVKLEHFSLNDNALTGTIPKELSALQKVRDLYLYGNKLTGTIPPELGGDATKGVEEFGMAAMADLRLFDNELGGPIPTLLGNLVHLEHLSLENNKLIGTVPTELGNLANLGKMRLDGNKLNGHVPPEVCHLTEQEGGDGTGVLVEFLADCGGDPPELVCDCCTECVEPGSVRKGGRLSGCCLFVAVGFR